MTTPPRSSPSSRNGCPELAFDIQAHRGGAALAPENSLAAFANALDIGVSTLECDVHISADGVAVLNHERTYAGQLIPLLTHAELTQLCPAGLEPIAALSDLLALLTARGADEVGLNIETKFDVTRLGERAPRERFVKVVTDLLADSPFLERTSIQSFDWTVLRMVREVDQRLALNALTNTDYLEVDQPGASPWLAGVDIDDYAGSIAAAASALGFDAISPSHTILTPAMVAEAHQAGLRVLPYTVNNEPMMQHLVRMGVDGLITDRPDLLREVLASMEQPLPRQYPGTRIA